MDRNDLAKMVGLNIRKYRTLQTLSQESLALDAGIHPAYLGQLERGEKCPNIDTLLKISNALGIPISKILDFENTDTSPQKLNYNNNNFKEITPLQQYLLDSLNKLSANKQKLLIEIIDNIITLYINR